MTKPALLKRQLGRLSKSRVSVGDHFFNGERPEHANRDQHIEGCGDAECDVHGAWQVPSWVAEVTAGEADHSKAEIGEERQGHTRYQVNCGWIRGRCE